MSHLSKVIRGAVFLGSVFTSISACGFRVEKGGTEQSNVVSVPGKVLGYNSLRSLVFQSRCIQCHGHKGGVNLETYSSAVSVLSRIENEVLIEKSMPPSGPLSHSEQKLVRDWISAGAPEGDVTLVPQAAPAPSSVPSPSAEPAAEPSSPGTSVPPRVTFAQVRDRVLIPQCLRCHDADGGHPKKGVAVNTYEDVMKNLDRIQSEALVDLTMPPRQSLSQTDRELLKSWIEQGAQP